jgi:hypothetical protein
MTTLHSCGHCPQPRSNSQCPADNHCHGTAKKDNDATHRNCDERVRERKRRVHRQERQVLRPIVPAVIRAAPCCRRARAHHGQLPRTTRNARRAFRSRGAPSRWPRTPTTPAALPKKANALETIRIMVSTSCDTFEHGSGRNTQQLPEQQQRGCRAGAHVLFLGSAACGHICRVRTRISAEVVGGGRCDDLVVTHEAEGQERSMQSTEDRRRKQQQLLQPPQRDPTRALARAEQGHGYLTAAMRWWQWLGLRRWRCGNGGVAMAGGTVVLERVGSQNQLR